MDAPRLNVARLAGYLGGWLVLSAFAGLAMLVFYRPAKSTVDIGRTSASPLPMPSGRQLTAGGSPGWTLRLHYTAVEKYHHGPPVSLTGCSGLACPGGPIRLGAYPRNFVQLVREEGSGEICSGKYAGRFLNWADPIGYWLDMVPRAADGQPLRRFASADSGTPQLSAGTVLRVLSCGRGVSCSRLRAATWTVTGVSTRYPERTVALYIGTETGPYFTAGEFGHAVLRIG